MTTIKKEFESKFEQFVTEQGLERGLIPVSIDSILSAFAAYAGAIPVSKALIGRALTKRYLKKQSTETLTQCYYLNKAI